MPPMPTKWIVPMESGKALMRRFSCRATIRLTRASTEPGQTSAAASGAGLRRGGGRAARGGERARGVRAAAANRLARATPGVKSRLRHHRCAACLGQGARIGRLVIVDRTRQRHQDRRASGNRQFRNGGGAGARDHKVRGGKPCGHVGEERSEIGLDAG